MTRLFNLESYCELCSYAHLYNQEIKTLITQEGNYLSQYKVFLERYYKQGFLTDFERAQELKLRDRAISATYLGLELPGDNQSLYIVPDRIDLLTLERFFKLGERHLYRSVYHYWNNIQQISENVDLSKPVVFLDLDSVTNEQYAPLNFSRSPDSSCFIPILNNREKIDRKINLFFNFRDSYDEIFLEISQKTINNNFLNLINERAAVQHLASCLKKINLFNFLHLYIEQNHFTIVVEILKEEKIYYKSVNLNISLLENLVLERIDLNSIKQIATQRKEFSFVVISPYNNLPKFRESLNGDNIFVPDRKNSQFSQIWEQKLQKNFPLFGQYLDQIEFQINKNGILQWIKVLSPDEAENIYYEGQSETKQFIGRIQETGQEYFTLPAPSATLPIQINGRDYCINGIAQDYLIKNPLEESKIESEKLKIRIEFLLKPGSAPELRVRDINNKYKIETELRDRQLIKKYYNCIPLQTILEKRQQEANILPNTTKTLTVINTLVQLHQENYYLNQERNYLRRLQKIKSHIKIAYQSINGNYNNGDLLLNINPNQSSLKQLQKTLSNSILAHLISLILNYLQSHQINTDKKNEIKNIIKHFLIFLGKTYNFSSNLSLQSFFNMHTLNLWKNKFGKDFGEYFMFLSRVAINKEFQVFYFKNFFYCLDPNQQLYQKDNYLWGYGRILAWYSEFQYLDNELEYLKHFTVILNHLLNQKRIQREVSEEYTRNAFLSLIYLLTFRERDLNFCRHNSAEFNSAKAVLNLYKDTPVYLKRISTKKSLNEYFEELLLGESSTDAISNMLQVD
jgi:hypothetical protein